MAYLRPAVLVYQEYARLTTPSQAVELTPCIVGPAYHIIDPIQDDPIPFVSDYSVAGITDAEFPFNSPGGVIDYDFVTILIKQAKAKLNATAITNAILDITEVTFPGHTALIEELQIGDVVEVVDTDTSDSGGETIVVKTEYHVIDIDRNEQKVHLNYSISPAPVGTVTVNVYRVIDQLWLKSDSPYLSFNTENKTFSLTGVKTTINSTLRDIVSGMVYIGYRSLRTDLTLLNTVYTIEEARAVFGRDLSENNPLGFAVALCLANTNVGVTFIGVPSTTLEGYTDAKDFLEGVDNVYSIIPLTTSVDVLTMFKNHCEMMSTPEEGAWRICLGSSELPTEKIRVDSTGALSLSPSEELVILHDPAGSFFSNGVRPGQNLILTKQDNTTITFPVHHVVAQDRLVFNNSESFNLADYDDGEGSLDEVSYKVEHIFNKRDQAEALKGVSSAYKSARFVNVWPNVCIVDGKQLPGYYLATVLGGMIGGLPSHHGFTRLSIGGVSGVRNSADYFNKEQLDIIASGGTFIFVQNNPSSPVFSRHQLTTDMSTIEFRELSFVKNFDFVSYLAKRVLDRFIGQYNITPGTLALLHSSMVSLFETLKLSSLPRIGSPVLGYSIESIRQLESTRDRVEIYVNVELPYVLNVVGIHLVSQ